MEGALLYPLLVSHFVQIVFQDLSTEGLILYLQKLSILVTAQESKSTDSQLEWMGQLNGQFCVHHGSWIIRRLERGC